MIPYVGILYSTVQYSTRVLVVVGGRRSAGRVGAPPASGGKPLQYKDICHSSTGQLSDQFLFLPSSPGVDDGEFWRAVG